MSWDITDTRAFVLTDLPLDTWTLREAIPDRTEVGPDNLRMIYEGRFSPAAGSNPSISAFYRGAIPPQYSGSGTWRVCSAVPSRLGGPIWRLDVSAKGQLSTQEPKIRWTDGSSSFSAENIAVPGLGVVANLSSEMPEVGMEVSYLAFSATPATPAVGIAATPPNPRPPTPTNPWTWIDEAIAVVHYPNGWVRKGVDTDRIVPGMWWITERYVYKFGVTG